MSSEKVELKLDWCSHEAAKFACEHWHYSKCMPAGKLVQVGVWENKIYIGCIIFGRGAINNIGKPYRLEQVECIELVRIALNKHYYPVSRILSLALKMLKKQSPGLRLIVSYADSGKGHSGGIYQATNWIFEGDSFDSWIVVNGKPTHRRSLGGKYGTNSLDWIIKNIDPRAERINMPAKHKYLMPLDDDMRKQIEPLRKPYPKKPCAGSETVTRQPIQAGEGGSIPTPALIDKQGEINAIR